MSIVICGDIGAEGLEKKIKNDRRRAETKRKSTYSAKYQAPTTLVVLIIPLVTISQHPLVPRSLVGK